MSHVIYRFCTWTLAVSKKNFNYAFKFISILQPMDIKHVTWLGMVLNMISYGSLIEHDSSRNELSFSFDLMIKALIPTGYRWTMIILEFFLKPIILELMRGKMLNRSHQIQDCINWVKWPSHRHCKIKSGSEFTLSNPVDNSYSEIHYAHNSFLK